MKNLNKKKFYEAPDTIVVSFKTERGFANSGDQPAYSRFTLGSKTENEGSDGLYVDRDNYGTATSYSWGEDNE